MNYGKIPKVLIYWDGCCGEEAAALHKAPWNSTPKIQGKLFLKLILLRVLFFYRISYYEFLW